MIKNSKKLFENLSKIQKSSLIFSLKNFIVKKNSEDQSFLYNEFMEEQNYYIKIQRPYFSFIKEALEQEKFLEDLRICIKDLCYQKKQKESQKPFLEKQKHFAREQRKKIQEFRMSHEKPTKKQLSYYKALCQKNGLILAPLENLSKLDLKNMIAKIVEKKEKN